MSHPDPFMQELYAKARLLKALLWFVIALDSVAIVLVGWFDWRLAAAIFLFWWSGNLKGRHHL